MHHDKIYATLSEELQVWKQFHFLCQDISSQLLHLIPPPHKMMSSLVQNGHVETQTMQFVQTVPTESYFVTFFFNFF